jgi:hypothetical protein
MPGVFVSLCGYRVAKAMMIQPLVPNPAQLPTPYQLSLLLGTYNGGILTVWNWISYLLWRRRQKMIPVFTFTLAILITTSAIAYMIWAADTWLHVTTSAILFSRVYRSSEQTHLVLNNGSSLSAYGLGIFPQCEGFYNNSTIPSDSNLNCSEEYFVKGAAVNNGYDILNNADPYRVLLTVPGNQTFPEVSFVSGSNTPNTDFIAATFAFSSSCKLLSKECNMRFLNDSYIIDGVSGALMYNCTAGFSGVLSENSQYDESTPPCISYGNGCYGIYQNSSLLTGMPMAGTEHINPFFVGISAQVKGLTDYLDCDPEVFSAFESIFFTLTCQVDVSDITYSIINGSVTILSSTPSNDTVALLSTGWESFSVGTPAVSNAIPMAVTAANGQAAPQNAFVTKFSTSLAQIFAAFSADSFMAYPNIMQQDRESIIVTRVPKAPLITF